MATSVHGTFTWGTTEIEGSPLKTLVVEIGFAKGERHDILTVMTETNDVVMGEIRKMARQDLFRDAHFIVLTGSMAVPQAIQIGLGLRGILDALILTFAYYSLDAMSYIVMQTAHSLSREIRLIPIEKVVWDPDQRFFVF